MAPKSTRLLFSLLSLAAPSMQVTHYETGSCQIIGDPDLYGIGVRVSYYLAFASGVIALLFGNARAVEDVKKGNAIVGFSLFIILVRNARQGSLAVLEWELVFTMVFLLMSAAYGPLCVFGDRATRAVLSIVYGLYSVLQPWVFFSLADQGRKEGCELRMFLFAYFDFYNTHWVGFLKFQSILITIVGVFFLGFGVLNTVRAVKDIYYGRNSGNSGNRDDGEDSDSDSDEDGQRDIFRGFAVISVASGSIAIAFTEKLVSGNNIDLSEASFTSTSQLIPFLVGVASFFSTVWTCVGDIMKERARGTRDVEEVREVMNDGKSEGQANA
ncbi:hypothetical protein B0H67DRAFT_92649 [Lasiosphaeris hirsuta]|uniref:Autophagy-related protein n=1 Tax=Lasiosphaeris hirsuta TaxID=260670 RepID=A0AA40EBD4_9PEZI|nr:hypothetical protein B0H67DRAFT_92649 [Lasiosphaeris hirsuta]